MSARSQDPRSPGRIYGRGMAFPPRLGPDGRFAWSEGPDSVRESIRVILLTELGERVMLPDFGAGLRRYLFEPNTTPVHRLIEEAITSSLERWERRVELQSVDVEPDPANPEVAFRFDPLYVERGFIAP